MPLSQYPVERNHFSAAQVEIKHDGFRIIARRKANAVRLYTRNGYDFTARFPKIVDAVASLPVRSCVIDGEAIGVDETGLSVFDALRLGFTTTPPYCAPSISSNSTARISGG